jgi:transcriptional regulator with GAF, ATPase, and Fis domain
VRIAEQPGELAELVEHLCARITGAADEPLVAEVVRAIERGLGVGYAFPGNVRELEQSVRRVLLTSSCVADTLAVREDGLAGLMERGVLSAEQLIGRYCALLYGRLHSYVEVARVTGLDRRTVKKHIEDATRALTVT